MLAVGRLAESEGLAEEERRSRVERGGVRDEPACTGVDVAGRRGDDELPRGDRQKDSEVSEEAVRA